MGMAMSRGVLRLLALSLDLPPAWFLDRFKRPLTTLRLLHYSAQPSDPEQVWAPSFTFKMMPLDYHEPPHERTGIFAALRPGCIVIQSKARRSSMCSMFHAPADIESTM